MPKKEKDTSFLRALGLLTTVGTVMIANLVVGLFLGHFLDKQFHTSPWMTLIFIILGSVSGARATFRLINK